MNPYKNRKAAPDSVIAHLRTCWRCRTGEWCSTAHRKGLTRDERDASIAFDRALNPDAYKVGGR